MKRTIVSAMAAFLLLGISATSVAAHPHAPAHYFGNCTDAEAGALYRSGIDWVRSSGQVRDRITGAAGRVLARALYPCVGGTGNFVSLSFIAAANVQGTDSIGTYNFVQTGIAKFNANATQCGNPNGNDPWISDQTTFVFTPGNNNGILCKAYWYDVNNDGHGDDPIGGHTYKFTINQHDSGASDLWRICITDVGTGVGDCHDIARSSNDFGLGGANAAWWGCETGNHANAMGVQANVADVTVSQTAYEKGDFPGVWNYTENSPIAQPWNPAIAAYDWVTDQTGLGEQVKCRTALHQ